MKINYSIILVLGLLICSCQKYDNQYIRKFVWKHAKGYSVQDFISFDNQYSVNEKNEILFKDSCVGKINSIEKTKLIIESPKEGILGYYVLHDTLK